MEKENPSLMYIDAVNVGAFLLRFPTHISVSLSSHARTDLSQLKTKV